MDVGDDYYTILGVERDASLDEIRRAYHRVARKLHPDVSEEAGATELFLEAQKAYEMLSDPVLREEYDKTLPPASKASPLVKLSTLYSRPALARLNEPQIIYVLLDLAAEVEAENVPRLPLNICLVIDRSTSMQGERMDMVKSTAIELVRQIQEEDHLSIVAFSDRAEVLVSPAQRMTRGAIEEQIRKIMTGGGTEIYQGLEAGYTEIRARASRNYINHIILITDGRTYGDEAVCMQIAEQAAQAGIVISSLGIGDEWNDAFLDELTSRTGGTCVYVSRPVDIKRFLWEKFDGLGRIFAERVMLELDFDSGIELANIFRLSPEAAPLQTTSPIPLGSLPQRPNLTVMLEFKVPPIPANLEHLSLANGKVSYDIPGKSNAGFVLPVSFSRPITSTTHIHPPPTRLLQALARLNLYRMQERANLNLAEGDREGATRRLQYLATHLFAQGKHELARTILNELDQIQREQKISEPGKKKIKYGTRALLLPANAPEE